MKKLPARWYLLLSLNLSLGVMGWMLIPNKHPEPTHIDHRLNDIQSQISTLQETVKNPADKINLNAMTNDFNRLANFIRELKPTDNEQLSQRVVESQAQLASKLDAVDSAIQSLKKKQNPITYLKSSALPFKVVSIDSIQQVSMASVEYDYQTIPLEKNDSLAGWTVLSVDFGKQRIELENSEKARVVVALVQDEAHA